MSTEAYPQAEACAAGLIPPPEAAQARGAAGRIARSLRRGAELFGLLNRDRQQEAIDLSLPPLGHLGAA